jgi:hypothetical protein
MARCGGPDPYETSGPVSLRATVLAARMRFLQYMEFHLPHDVRGAPPPHRSRPTLVAVNPEEPVKFLTY